MVAVYIIRPPSRPLAIQKHRNLITVFYVHCPHIIVRRKPSTRLRIQARIIQPVIQSEAAVITGCGPFKFISLKNPPGRKWMTR